MVTFFDHCFPSVASTEGDAGSCPSVLRRAGSDAPGFSMNHLMKSRRTPDLPSLWWSVAAPNSSQSSPSMRKLLRLVPFDGMRLRVS